jgi:hypothetical protein
MFNTFLTTASALLLASLATSSPLAKPDISVVEANQACGVHVRQGTGAGLPIVAEAYAPETEGHQLLASGGGDAGFGNIDIDIHRQGWLLVITKSNNDDGDDTLKFGFGEDIWTNNDNGRCSTGNWDGGFRQMDCSFSC